MADTIYIQDMQFYGRHGVFLEEQKLGQRFSVSLVLTLDLQPSATQDDLTLTVNYGDVYNRVKEIIEGVPYKLLEAVAHRICMALLHAYPIVHGVRVRLDKPGAPIPGIFASVGVELERSQADLQVDNGSDE